MPTLREEMERLTSGPLFDGRFGLLIVSEDAFRELKDAGLKPDSRLKEHGFKSVVVNGIPVIFNHGYHDFIAIENELIGILANQPPKEKE